MVLYRWIVDMTLRNLTYLNPSFPHDKWRHQIIVHRGYLQGIPYDKDVGLAGVGAVICYRSINYWYLMKGLNASACLPEY